MRKMKHIILGTGLMLSVLFIAGCGKETDNSKPVTRSEFKLNTKVDVTLYDHKNNDILDGFFELCDYYEKIYSRTLETSELYKLNEGLLDKVEGKENTYYVSNELGDLIEYGMKYSKLSDGKFDITVEPVSALWDFSSEEDIVPNEEIISNNLKYVDYRKFNLSGNIVSFDNENMGIDLGAIAKGYIADRLKEYLIEQGVTSGIINLGGNVLLVGSKPGDQPFNIGVQKPFADRNEIVSIMELEDVSVVSSGIYERAFTVDGRFYHHLLNTETGYPLDNGLVGVTIISKYSVDGDGFSTSTFALGLEEGMKLIESLPDTYGVFITDDYTLHYTKGFLENIKVNEVE